MSVTAGRRLDATWILDPSVGELIRFKACKLSRSTGFSRSDQSDIEQELRVHLLGNLAAFDAKRSQPSTFAARIIKNKATSIRRAARRQKRDAADQVSIDAIFNDGCGTPTTFAQSIDESDGRRHTGQRLLDETEVIQRRIDIADANQDLSPELRDMAALLSHVPRYVAAQVMGISRRQAGLYVETLRECYEERGMDV